MKTLLRIAGVAAIIFGSIMTLGYALQFLAQPPKPFGFAQFVGILLFGVGPIALGRYMIKKTRPRAGLTLVGAPPGTGARFRAYIYQVLNSMHTRFFQSLHNLQQQPGGYMNVFRPTLIMGLVAGAVFYVIAGIINIAPGEVGIIVKMLGANRGMQKETLPTGTRWIDPLIYDVEIYDTRATQQQQQEEMPSNTADGQPISVDLSLEVSLNPALVPDLHQKVGRDYMERVVFPALRSNIRNHTSQKTSDEIYTGAGRRFVQDIIQAEMREKLEPLGILISVNLRDIHFLNQDFIKVLEDKAEAQQRVTIAERQAAQAANDAIRVGNTAEGEKQKSIKVAEATRETRRLEGEGYRLQKEEEAKGILAVATAEAEGTRLKALALSGAGSSALVSMEWAKQMGPNVKVYGYPLGAPGTTGIFNVDGILGDALKIKGDKP
ncbi:MAG: hypothetical protein A3H91_03755 [Gammaproteobacteria bacterium RIFCSPLOWO2_02_FULL_61_13]|nr:MAG: hypothetical protein A3H91_03755 [Gammaproteobacteria bacterium RIFCSPLOWO2_02_FULL_61_13]